MRITPSTGTSRRATWILALTAVLILGVASGVVAADQFNDVPDDHPFHDEISWMADTGISEGYEGGTEFRPTNEVTRQAMAAFMMRVAGQDPEVDPMVDAATAEQATTADSAADANALEGFTLDEIKPLVWTQRDETTLGTHESGVNEVEVNSLDVLAPGDGLLTISGTTYVNNNDASAIDYVLIPYLDGSRTEESSVSGYFMAEADGGGTDRGYLTYTVSVPVTEGLHTVSQQVETFDGTTADFYHNHSNLTVQFTPAASVTVSATAGSNDATSANGDG